MNYRILLTASLLVLATACGTETKDIPVADAGNTSDAQLGDTTADTVSDTVAADTGGTPDTTATDASDVLDAGGDVVAPLYTNCVALSDCVAEACKTNAKDCEKPCLAAASADALAKAVPLLGCIQGQCTQGMCKDATDTTCMDDCLGQKCGLPLTACVDDGKAGAAQCGEAMGCFDTCKIASGTPISCIAKCYNALAAGGKQALGKLLTCFQAKGGQEACAGEMIQCLVGGKTGDKGCYTFFGCQQTCGEGEDLQCIGNCAGQMTAAGQNALIDALPCFGAESTPVCQAKMLACIAPTGADSCVQTFDCIGKCPSGGPGQDPGPACIFECFHGGAADTIGLFTELTPCGDPGSDKSKCADGFLKCAKPAGTKTCGQVTSCSQACSNQGPGCLLKCLADGSAAATADWKAAYVCTQACGKQCQGDKDPKACEDACNATKCLAEITKCMPIT
jgi:hypothetical protein